jgi:hypothetical protein
MFKYVGIAVYTLYTVGRSVSQMVGGGGEERNEGVLY